MHWRHCKGEWRTEKLYSVDDVWKYDDAYFNDYYVPDAPVTLKTFGICSRPADDHIVNRFVEKYIFHYILSGKGWFNGIPFEAGDIVFCTNAIPYSLSSHKYDPCIYAWISFSGGKSEKYLDIMGISGILRIYKSKHTDSINKILYDMMEVDHSDIETALYLEAKFIELLSLSAPTDDGKSSKSSKKNTNKRVNAAIQYISENFRNPELRIEDIAAAVSTNKKYLQRIFRDTMEISIYQYISKLRMDAAVTLLNSSNYNINEISEYVGYNDRRTFSEIFKKHFGVPPTKYTEQ